MGKVSSFKLWVGKVKMGLTTGGFTVLIPKQGLTINKIAANWL